MIQGIPKCITFEKVGYRDIYWCHCLNEPMIIEYRGNDPFCPSCQDFDPEYHTFICHVLKPRVQ